jgi:hypothetical protein
MKFTVELDARIDGLAQSGVVKIKGEMKGASDTEAQGQKISLDLDLLMVGSKSKVLLK